MRRISATLLALAPLASAVAYEVDTHALVTSQAFDRSVLAQPELRVALGLARFGAEAPGERPFQVPPGAAYGANPNAYLDFAHLS